MRYRLRDGAQTEENIKICARHGAGNSVQRLACHGEELAHEAELASVTRVGFCYTLRPLACPTKNYAGHSSLRVYRPLDEKQSWQPIWASPLKAKELLLHNSVANLPQHRKGLRTSKLMIGQNMKEVF